MSVMIVYLHLKFLYKDEGILNETHQFIVAILNTCVPTFFAISGYLFFRHFKFDQLKDKIRRRVKSLLIPYLIWNIVYVAFMLAMSYAGLTSYKIDPSLLNILKAILNAECSPLWFVRYLMYFVLLAPVTYFFLRNKIIGAITLMFVLGFNYYNFTSGQLGVQINVNANSFAMLNYQYAYYALGAYCALNFSKIVEAVNFKKSLIGLLSIVLLIVIYWCYLKDNGNIATFHLFRFFWIPALWYAIETLPSVTSKPWMKFAFFIYCSHMFLIYCFQGIIEKIYPHMGIFQPLFACIEYTLMGGVIVYLLIKAAKFLKTKSLASFRLISGSRG